MLVQLSSEESHIIDGLVAAGTFASADEAVREGVRLLISREALKLELQQAEADLDAGKGIPAEEVFAELRARATARLSKGQ
jgi:antitoxin ParD1/3/4